MTPRKAAPSRERFILTLAPAPSEIPPHVRVKALLKLALRTFALRCVSIVHRDGAA